MRKVISFLIVLLMVAAVPAANAVVFAQPETTATPSASPTQTPKASPASTPDTDADADETEEPTGEPSEEPSEEPTEEPDEPVYPDAPVGDYPPYNEDPEHYRVEVDLTNCAVFVYERDEEGMYTVLVREMIMTSGNEENRTPAGTFRIGYMKERFGHFLAFRGDYAQYWTQVVNGVYFHSILYRSFDTSTLTSGSYGNLGRNVSHGCIRLYVEDARWIYYNIPAGTICNLSNRPRNPELTKRLKKTIPFSQYDPGEDPNPKPEPEYMYCNADAVPMSTGFFGPKDTGTGTVNRGEMVEVLQHGKEFLKIKIVESGREGYTYARYFQKDEPGEIEIKDGEIGVAHLRREQVIYTQPGGEPLKNRAWKNTDYQILEITDEHFKVKLGDVEGYIPIAQMDFMVYPEGTEFMVISKSRAQKLSMRAKPEDSAEAIEMLDFGDEGRVFYYGPEYTLIRCRGQFGYVQSKYISVEFHAVDEQTDEVLPDDVSPSEIDESVPTNGNGNGAGDTPETTTGQPASETPSAGATPSAGSTPSAGASEKPAATPTPSATPKAGT